MLQRPSCIPHKGFWALAVWLAATALPLGGVQGGEPQGFLETIHRHITRGSTVPDNGDLNPYAVVVAPVSAGKIQKDDVLVTNFNNLSNLQGTGGTIVDYNPATKKTTLFASCGRRSSGTMFSRSQWSPIETGQSCMSSHRLGTISA